MWSIESRFGICDFVATGGRFETKEPIMGGASTATDTSVSGTKETSVASAYEISRLGLKRLACPALSRAVLKRSSLTGAQQDLCGSN